MHTNAPKGYDVSVFGTQRLQATFPDVAGVEAFLASVQNGMSFANVFPPSCSLPNGCDWFFVPHHCPEAHLGNRSVALDSNGDATWVQCSNAERYLAESLAHLDSGAHVLALTVFGPQPLPVEDLTYTIPDDEDDDLLVDDFADPV